MPTSDFWESFARGMREHLPDFIVQREMRRAASSTGGKSYPKKVDDVTNTERLALENISSRSLSESSDKDITELHSRTHSVYSSKFSGTSRGSPSKEVIVNAHSILVEEMNDRDIEHPESDDRIHKVQVVKVEKSDARIAMLGFSQDQAEEVLSSQGIPVSAALVGSSEIIKSLPSLPRLGSVLAAGVDAGRSVTGESGSIDDLRGVCIVNDLPVYITYSASLNGVYSRALDSDLHAALEDADLIEKSSLFASPGGKTYLISTIVPLMPPHKTYVETFAGGASIFFSKTPSAREVINDRAQDIYETYLTIKSMSDEDIAQLDKLDWTIKRSVWEAARNSNPSDRLGKLYKFLYLTGSSYGGQRGKSFQTRRDGDTLQVVRRIAKARDRLKNTTILNKDAVDLISRFDSPDTLFYIDPPYPAEWKESQGRTYTYDDLDKLFTALKGIKGKFLMSLATRDISHVPKGYTVRRIRARRSLHTAPAARGDNPEEVNRIDYEILVSNYDISKSQPDASDVHINSPTKAKLYDEDEYDTDLSQSDIAKVEIIKSEKEKHLVWVVVMKPDFVDGEGHWFSPKTIEETAHQWLLKGGPAWLEHSKSRSDIKVVESYTLLEDLAFEGRKVDKGSWIAVFWIPDDKIWEDIKKGRYRGGSIRGFAKLVKGGPNGR